VELRVAHASGELFDNDVGRARVTDIQIIDNQWSTDVYINDCFNLHGDLPCERPTR
jgi:hypothetical protein